MPAGYVFIDRENSKDVAVVYETEEAAKEAVTKDIFIDYLCERDAVDCYATTEDPKLSERDLIIRSDVEWLLLGGK